MKADITKMEVDAVVNPSNEDLKDGKSGVCGAIHQAAGKELAEECSLLGGCRTGEARITKGYHLDAKYVIHTVGPVYQKTKEKAPALLASCYRNCMEFARLYHINTIAFPAISTGSFGYPKQEAAVVALSALEQWGKEHPDYPGIVFLVSTSDETVKIYQQLRNS